MRSCVGRVLAAMIAVAAFAVIQRASAGGGGNPIPPPSRFQSNKGASPGSDVTGRDRLPIQGGIDG